VTGSSDGRRVGTVLWDLDGTLVGLRYRTFNLLMPLLAAKALRDIVPPRRFPRVFKEVIAGLRQNTTGRTNYEHLVHLLSHRTGAAPEAVETRFRHLTTVEFPRLRWCFSPVPPAVEIVAGLARHGRAQVVATNPLWPEGTVTDRLAWAGLDSGHFAFIASGENMSRSKPSIEYYEELLERLGTSPADCVMIGNDAKNDPPATRLGIPVFLLRSRSRRPVELDPLVVADRLTIGDWAGLPAWLGLGASRSLEEGEPCSSS
jgi:FMN phosphatase YigB (HAD superfamily)